MRTKMMKSVNNYFNLKFEDESVLLCFSHERDENILQIDEVKDKIKLAIKSYNELEEHWKGYFEKQPIKKLLATTPTNLRHKKFQAILIILESFYTETRNDFSFYYIEKTQTKRENKRFIKGLKETELFGEIDLIELERQ